jgi:hypothetical protein
MEYSKIEHRGWLSRELTAAAEEVEKWSAGMRKRNTVVDTRELDQEVLSNSASSQREKPVLDSDKTSTFR